MKNAVMFLMSLLIWFLLACNGRQKRENMPKIGIIPQPLDPMDVKLFKYKCNLGERYEIRKIKLQNNAYDKVKVWCRDICDIGHPFLLYDSVSKMRNDTVVEIDLINTSSGIPIELSQGRDSVIYFKSRAAESGFRFKYVFAVKVDSMGFEQAVECQFIDVN